MVAAGGDYGATRPDRSSLSSVLNRKHALRLVGAATLGLCVLAVTLAVEQANESSGSIVLESKHKSGSSVGDIQKQLLKAKELFDGAPPVPSNPSGSSGLAGPSSSSSSGAVSSGGRGRGGLGLKGMSQAQFESEVDGAVTKKVALVLLNTMRPLKRVLFEQQKKIEELRHEKNQEIAAEKRIAARLSNNLKKGLLTHLKTDVDMEVKHVLTPKDLLRAEKSKKALAKKLSHAKAAKHAQAEQEKQADVRSAVKHSMNKALNGVYEAEKKAKEADKKQEREAAAKRESKHEQREQSTSSASTSSGAGKRKCDPLAGLYKSGIVSWC